MNNDHQWHVFDSAAEASDACARFISEQIQQCLARQPHCTIALPGGKTPADCLQQISRQSIDWDRTHWLPGDERCLPVGDDERNDTLFRQHFLGLIPLPAENFHAMPAELGAEQGALAFTREIVPWLPLDIAFLGMGEDGHTASLFPGNTALSLESAAVPVYDAPKAPPERISLSRHTLRHAATRCVLTLGESKQEAIQRIRAGETLPINDIGPIHWFVDRAASGV